jgi:hypothetical protein
VVLSSCGGGGGSSCEDDYVASVWPVVIRDV